MPDGKLRGGGDAPCHKWRKGSDLQHCLLGNILETLRHRPKTHTEPPKMTINIALITSEALVLGCDSISSVTQYLLDPWPFIARDGQGEIVADEANRVTAQFDYGALVPVVTHAFGGVTKMFSLSTGHVEVAAITAGLAKLNEQTIRGIAVEFSHQPREEKTVKEVATSFLLFIKEKFDIHCAESQTPPEFQSDIEFLLGGFGENDSFPSLYRLKVKENSLECVYEKGKSGLAWSGQADGVERLIFGVDSQLRSHIALEANRLVDSVHQDMKDAMLRIIGDVLLAAGLETLPENINTELPPVPIAELPWGQFRLDVDFANLPLQDAVDFVSYLVNLQSGRSKFVRGVATVGGRTHIGIITKGDPLKMLNEPEIAHRNVGFTNDY
jgi:hypothetical protein